jgi:pimeloyl-ACP methyl ester carboxylesterase
MERTAYSQPRGALLYFHGNGCDVGQMQSYPPLHDLCRHLGLHLVLVEYPGYGPSPGLPNETSVMAAATAAYHFVCTALRVPPGRIIFYATSIGTGVAVELAARVNAAVEQDAGRCATAAPQQAEAEERATRSSEKTVRPRTTRAAISSDMAAAMPAARPWGMLLEAPPMSIRRVAAGFVSAASSLMQDRFDSLHRLPQVGDVPVFFVHGDCDELIPAEHSQTLAQVAQSEQCEVVIVPGGTHNDLLGPWPARAIDFFEQAFHGGAGTMADDPPLLSEADVWAALPPQPSEEQLEAQAERQHAQVEASERAIMRLSSVADSFAGAVAYMASCFTFRRE